MDDPIAMMILITALFVVTLLSYVFVLIFGNKNESR